MQQSSLARFTNFGTSAVWLGAATEPMHLSYEQVIWLKDALGRWLDTGEFDGEPDEQAIAFLEAQP